MDTYEKLKELAKLRRQKAELERQQKDAIQAIIPPELMTQIEKVEIYYHARQIDADQQAERLEAEIKADVITLGATVKSAGLQAVYSAPSYTWDGDKLTGYAAAHPEILAFRKPKAAVVSIRAAK